MALVLSPTRELAFQIAEQFQALGEGVGVRVATLVGLLAEERAGAGAGRGRPPAEHGLRGRAGQDPLAAAIARPPTHLLVLRHHDLAGGQTAACVAAAQAHCQGGGVAQVRHGGHAGAALPVRAGQVQRLLPDVFDRGVCAPEQLLGVCRHAAQCAAADAAAAQPRLPGGVHSRRYVAAEAAGRAGQVQKRRTAGAGGDGCGLARSGHPAGGRGDQLRHPGARQGLYPPRGAHCTRRPHRARGESGVAVRRGGVSAGRAVDRPAAGALSGRGTGRSVDVDGAGERGGAAGGAGDARRASAKAREERRRRCRATASSTSKRRIKGKVNFTAAVVKSAPPTGRVGRLGRSAQRRDRCRRCWNFVAGCTTRRSPRPAFSPPPPPPVSPGTRTAPTPIPSCRPRSPLCGRAPPPACRREPPAPPPPASDSPQ
eukprot:ctg_224.g157